MFAHVVDGDPFIGSVAGTFRRLVGHRGPLLWQTADYAVVWFALVAVLRAILLRKTIGMCYRNDFSGVRTLRGRIRHLIVWVLAWLPFIHPVFIFPPPGPARSTWDWIYDPEWWDLAELRISVSEVQVPQDNDGIVLFIGNVDRLKGVEFFVDTAEASARRGARLKYLIVGRGERLEAGLARRFGEAGGEVISAYPSDSEFLGYVASARYLWCCYHPAYDQSSGIFGRSLQLGIPAIVREGSLLAEYGRKFGNSIVTDYGDAAGLAARLEGLVPEGAEPACVDNLKAQARRVLRPLCGLGA